MGRVFSEPDVADLAASRLQRWLEMPRETALSFFDPDPDMDIRPLLSAIRVPTLIAHGTEDRQVPFAAAEYLAAHIAGAQLYPFVGYGHVPLFTATQEFCDVLRAFVRTGEVPAQTLCMSGSPFRLPAARGSIVLPNPPSHPSRHGVPQRSCPTGCNRTRSAAARPSSSCCRPKASRRSSAIPARPSCRSCMRSPTIPTWATCSACRRPIVVAMADGYARASGKLAACNVHVAPGLGNAIGALYTAHVSGTPIIVTAGQQEQGHGLKEPLLYAPLVPIAAPVVKWAVEVARLADLPRIVHRAAKVALTPPTGPVFISLPGDILNDFGAIELGAADPRRYGEPAPRMRRCARSPSACWRPRSRSSSPGMRSSRAMRSRRQHPRRGAGRAGLPADRGERRALPVRASPVFGPAVARPAPRARAAGAVRHAGLRRRRRAADVGAQRGRAAAAAPAGRPDRPARLGDGQELSGSARGARRRQGDLEGARAPDRRARR